jgi:hypothetical protein
LLAGGDDHALPVAQAFVHLLAAELDHRAPHHEGLDGGNAQFHRLLQGQIHALAAGDALGQGDAQGRLPFRGGAAGDARERGLAAQFQDGGVLRAIAVEQGERIAVAQAQGAHGMARRLEGQFDLAAGRQGQVAVEAGHHGWPRVG